MKKRIKISLIVIIVVVIGAAASGTYIFLGGKSGSVEEPGEQILTVEAVPGTVSVRVEGPSIVEPYMVQDIRSRVSGTVTYAPSEGDRVSAGATVVRFDTSELESAVKQAVLNVDQSTIDLKKAVISIY
jgi:multidrug efflux pump subunit AcrA (membrane-fusion protein)